LAGAQEGSSASAVLVAALEVAREAGRDDLASRLEAAVGRTRRPSTVVCVVGEFKQGKSTLVNTLVGEDVCAVDDDLATSVVTLLEHGEERTATAHRRTDQGRQSAAIDASRVPAIISEAGNPDNRMAIERVDLTLPSPFLKTGISLIDTPGVGGLGGAQRATLAFLPLADALLFVSDASAELSAPEVDFLQRAVEACPSVVLVLSKIDLYPHWRRIAELDQGHLERAGIDVPVVPVSSHLRQRAVLLRDKQLSEESGFNEIGRLLATTVLDPARTASTTRALQEAQGALDQILSTQQTEAELADPARADATIAELEKAKAELEHLRGPGARWSVLLSDQMQNLGAEVNHDLRGAMREATRTIDEGTEDGTRTKHFEQVAAEVQADVIDAVQQVQERLQRGVVEAQQAVIDLLRDEAPSLPGLAGLAPDGDIGRFWSDLDQDPARFGTAKKVVSGANQVADALRGASGGLMVLGMVHTLIPMVSQTLLMSTPFTIGLGVYFGGRSVMDARKRRIASKRAEARTSVRKVIDDISFEVGDQVATVLRLSQQSLREDFSDRFAELQRSTAELLQGAQETAQRTAAEVQAAAQALAQATARTQQVLAAVEQELAR
jgi:GTPase SAR1 family protein